jgi:hypothetical protein
VSDEQRRCETRTASDGTVVRVQGSIDQDTLDRITAEVKARFERECHALSDVPMPEIAQRIHGGRETYWCGREAGHEPPHQHPDPAVTGRPPMIEWT